MIRPLGSEFLCSVQMCRRRWIMFGMESTLLREGALLLRLLHVKRIYQFITVSPSVTILQTSIPTSGGDNLFSISMFFQHKEKLLVGPSILNIVKHGPHVWSSPHLATSHSPSWRFLAPNLGFWSEPSSAAGRAVACGGVRPTSCENQRPWNVFHPPSTSNTLKFTTLTCLY